MRPNYFALSNQLRPSNRHQHKKCDGPTQTVQCNWWNSSSNLAPKHNITGPEQSSQCKQSVRMGYHLAEAKQIVHYDSPPISPKAAVSATPAVNENARLRITATFAPRCPSGLRKDIRDSHHVLEVFGSNINV
jgi:hypothetical protein